MAGGLVSPGRLPQGLGVACCHPKLTHSHTLAHVHTHTHSCSHIILTHTPIHNIKFTHHILTVHRHTLTSMTHIRLVSRTLTIHTHTALTCSHALLYTNTHTHAQTHFNPN